MARPKSLPEGERISITVPHDLMALIRTRVQEEGSSLSKVVEASLRKALVEPESSPAPSAFDAKSFPQHWDGGDLRERLIDLRIRQKDLAEALSHKLNHRVTPGTLSCWLLRKSPFPTWALEPIQEILRTWDRRNSTKYRIGSRSPVV